MNTIEGLHFLGLGSAFNPEMDNTSAWFAEKGIFFLLDCGETVFGKIWDIPQFKEASKVAVILTNMHSDHVGSLGTLLSYCAMVVHKQVEIYYPSDQLGPYLSMVGIDKSFYTHVREVPTSWDLQLAAYPVRHAPDMDCFGYVLHLGGKVLYYSGDAAEVPKPILKQFFENEIDILFQDTSMEDSKHHCPLVKLEQAIPPAYRARVYSMHIANRQNIEAITQKGFKVVSA